MSFYTKMPIFQVETATGHEILPTMKEAELVYQQKIKSNIPCELYKEGIKVKEYKPETLFNDIINV